MFGHKFSARSRSNFRIDLPRAQNNGDGQEMQLVRGASISRLVPYYTEITTSFCEKLRLTTVFYFSGSWILQVFVSQRKIY